LILPKDIVQKRSHYVPLLLLVIYALCQPELLALANPLQEFASKAD